MSTLPFDSREIEEGRVGLPEARTAADAGPSSDNFPPASPTSTTRSSFSKFAGSFRGIWNYFPGRPKFSIWQTIWSHWIQRKGRPNESKRDGGPTRPGFNIRNVTKCPKGYPQLAAFLDSDEGYSIYRRFGYVQARLLLEKQDEMHQLEKKLIRVDKKHQQSESHRLTTRSREPKHEILEQLETKYHEYAHLLCTAQRMMALNRPASSDYESVVNYVSDRRPVIADERSFVYHKEDMVTLRPGREHAWLDAGIERVLKALHCSFIEFLFCSEDTRQKSDDPQSIYYTRERIERLAVGIIVFMVLILLLVPIYILYHLVADVGTNRAYAVCIGVLLIFTLTFSAMLSLFTRAQRHEIFGAAAAYCAVLVVFLGNVGPVGDN